MCGIVQQVCQRKAGSFFFLDTEIEHTIIWEDMQNGTILEINKCLCENYLIYD